MQHIGISFTQNSFQIVLPAEGSPREVLHSKQMAFSEPAQDFRLFTESALNDIREGLARFLAEFNVSSAYLNVSIPYNQAYTCWVFLPAGADKNVKRKQVQWTLKQQLPEELSRYKISLLKEQPHTDTSVKVLVVALEKELIRQFMTAVEELNVELNALLIDSLALESFIQTEENTGSVLQLVKVAFPVIENHFFENGQYMLTFLDNLALDDRPLKESVAEIVNGKNKEYQQWREQESSQQVKTIFYGDKSLTGCLPDIAKKINAPLEQPAVSGKDTSTVHSLAIEALGCII